MNEKTIHMNQAQTPPAYQADQNHQPDHETYVLLMSLALDGMLAPDEEADLHRHLGQCSHCAGTWAAWSSLHVRFAAQPAVAPTPGFGERFELRRIQQVRRRRLWMGGVVALLSAALWGTILVVGVLVSGYFLNNPTGTLPQIIYEVTYTWAGLSAAVQAMWRGITVAMSTSNLPFYILGYTVLTGAVMVMWTNYLRRTVHPATLPSPIR